MEFKDALKKIRQERSLSQQKLAELIGVKQYVIASWETGRSEPSIKDLISLKKALNVPLEYLLGIVCELPKYHEVIEIIDNLNNDDQDRLIDIIKQINDYKTK